MLKKLIACFLLVILSFSLMYSGNAVQASCDRVWSFSESQSRGLELVEESVSLEEIELFEGNLLPEPDNVAVNFEPMCGGGKLPPQGWSAVRSGARFTNSTKNVDNYVKNASSAQATKDFANLAPGARVQKYVNSDGSYTFVKFSLQGDIRLYKASSTKTTSIWWDRQKIRYMD